MKISICTTTAREGFADFQAMMIAQQEYPIDDLEWVLIDFAYETRIKTLKQISLNTGLSIIHSPNVRDATKFFRDITRNRNKALSLATGDTVIFLDDYAMIPKEFVKEHVEILKLGRVSAGRMFRLETPITNEILAYHIDPPQMLGKYAGHIGKDYRDRGDANFYRATGITYTGNLGIPREIFEKLNGFDPRMESGLEDCDFGMRAFMAGYKTVYNPKGYTINLETGNIPYTYSFDHSHDVEPFISNPNNNFAGNAKLPENEHMKVHFHEAYRIAECKVCGATGMIDPNELMAYKEKNNEIVVPSGISGGLDTLLSNQ